MFPNIAGFLSAVFEPTFILTLKLLVSNIVGPKNDKLYVCQSYVKDDPNNKILFSISLLSNQTVLYRFRGPN